jgi:hypothetical protein
MGIFSSLAFAIILTNISFFFAFEKAHYYLILRFAKVGLKPLEKHGKVYFIPYLIDQYCPVFFAK